MTLLTFEPPLGVEVSDCTSAPSAIKTTESSRASIHTQIRVGLSFGALGALYRQLVMGQTKEGGRDQHAPGPADAIDDIDNVAVGLASTWR